MAAPEQDGATFAAALDAVDRQDVGALRGLLALSQSLATAAGAFGETALHRCAHGPTGGLTVLSLKAEQVAQLLLSSRADANAETEAGETPLLLAVRAAVLHGLVRVLLEGRAEPGRPERTSGQTALMAAACSRDSSLCRLLVDARADPLQRDWQGRTARDLAPSPGCAKFLAEQEAGVTAPRMGAEVVDVLDVLDVSGNVVTSFRVAAVATVRRAKQRIYEEHGIPLFQQRLAHGTSVLDDGDATAALPAPSVLTLVIVAADPNAGDELLDAAEEGDVEAAKEALQDAADPNHVDDDGWTPLAVAAHCGHAQIARVLCDAGADAGATSMFMAADAGHAEVVRVLSQARASVDKAASNGVTPLLAASCQGHSEVVRALCERGARHDVPVDEMPLFTAAKRGHLAVVHCLLEAGADKDRQSHDGQTPLQAAAQKGYIEVVRLLCDGVEQEAALSPRHRDLVRMAARGLGCMY